MKGATEEVLYAQWAPLRYSLTVTASGDGTASGTDSVLCGDEKPITAAPEANASFLGWHIQEGSATITDSTSASTTVTLTDGNAVVVAVFTAGSGTVFKRTYGGTNSDAGYSVHKTSDGGYIITGYTTESGSGLPSLYLLNVAEDGTELWSKIFVTPGRSLGYSVDLTADGGYIIAGSTETGIEGNSHIYLLKTDANGDSLWTQTFEGAQASFANEVQQADDDGFVITSCMLGTYDNMTEMSNDEVYLIRTDANGEVR